MDFKAPIDITAVLTAVKKHKDILKGVDVLDAFAILKHFYSDSWHYRLD